MSDIELAFSISKRVVAGELTQTAAAESIHRSFGTNINSATIMISVYKKMIQGQEFKRALSSSQMNYYLGRMLAEGGAEALRNPVNALAFHISYYEQKNQVVLHRLRDIYQLYENLCRQPESFRDLESEFVREVNYALSLPAPERARRSIEYPEIPLTRTTTLQAFIRNPYVVAQVLTRANGVCEDCGSNAPFIRRSDNTPYLEVHHQLRLADGGQDTVENAIALCPNCHRRHHYG